MQVIRKSEYLDYDCTLDVGISGCINISRDILLDATQKEHVSNVHEALKFVSLTQIRSISASFLFSVTILFCWISFRRRKHDLNHVLYQCTLAF